MATPDVKAKCHAVPAAELCPHARADGQRSNPGRPGPRSNEVIGHQGLVRGHKISYLLISVSVCQVTLSMAREDLQVRVCITYQSTASLLGGKPRSLRHAPQRRTLCRVVWGSHSVLRLAPRKRPGWLRLLVDDAASSKSGRPLVSRRPGTREAHGPQWSARFRASTSRRVLGGTTTILATLPQAHHRASVRSSTRADEACSFAPGLNRRFPNART
jgi:hypothetical protein